MNPRQRRGVLLVGLAVVGSVAVFLAVSNYVAQVAAQVGPTAPVLRLAADVGPYEELTAELVEPVELPERWAPATAIRDLGQVEGMVLPAPLPAGTVLQDGMLVDPPVLEEGERELAILVDAETGVAGKIGTGSLVDIYAAFAGDEGRPPRASIVVESARIIDVGTPTVRGGEDPTGAFGDGEVVPVTFGLSIDESLRLAYIESFAASVRLALRTPLDDAELGDRERIYQPLDDDTDDPETGA